MSDKEISDVAESGVFSRGCHAVQYRKSAMLRAGAIAAAKRMDVHLIPSAANLRL